MKEVVQSASCRRVPAPNENKTKKESQTVKRIREKDIDDVIEDVINSEAEAGSMTSSRKDPLRCQRDPLVEHVPDFKFTPSCMDYIITVDYGARPKLKNYYG